MFDRDKAEAEFLAGTISAADEAELRNVTAALNWFALTKIRDKSKCAAFLKDKSPVEILLWMMRSGDLDPQTRAQCAIALLPYQPDKKDAIESTGQT